MPFICADRICLLVDESCFEEGFSCVKFTNEYEDERAYDKDC